jgi:hypothetical protein
MMEQLKDFFNWKRNPANVFYLVWPLAGMGFGSLLLGALLHATQEHDFAYLAIFIVLMGFFALVAYGMYRNYKKLRTLDTPDMEEAAQWRDWETYDRLRQERSAREAQHDRWIMNAVIGYGGLIILSIAFLPLLLRHV